MMWKGRPLTASSARQRIQRQNAHRRPLSRTPTARRRESGKWKKAGRSFQASPLPSTAFRSQYKVRL
jgi:hypothetical protein